MSHTSWSSTAPMGSGSPYHQDPSPGGAPVLTPDGHWRWAGDHWELRDDPDADAETDTEDAADDGPASESDPAADEGSPASLD